MLHANRASIVESIVASFEDLHHDRIPRVASLTEQLPWTEAEASQPTDPELFWLDSEADAFEPAPEDWKEYSAWSRILDGGCGDAELSPDEQDLLTASVDDRTYREMLQDELADRYADDHYAELYG